MTPFPLFAENGFVELLQMLTLALGALAFGLSAVIARAPGGPLLLLGATAMGVAALREFDVETGSAFFAYLTSSVPRVQLATVGVIGAGWLALQRPWASPGRHLAAVGPLAAPLGAAVIIVLVGDGLENLGLAHPAVQALEELMELAGYGLAAAIGLRTVVRVLRRPGRPAYRKVTTPARFDPVKLAAGSRVR